MAGSRIRQGLLCSFFLCATIVHLGCAAQKAEMRKNAESLPKPAWTITGAHPSFPSPGYIRGVGLAKEGKNPAADRQSADQNAFSEIISQISADVLSEISVKKIGILGDKGETVLERVTTDTKLRSNLKVGGLSIVERFYSPSEKIYYSLGVIDRYAASAPYRRELLQYREDYQKYLESAFQYRKSGKISQALLSLKDAYHSALKFNEIFSTYKILAGEVASAEPALSSAPSSAVILSTLSEIISKLQMDIAGGNNQKFMTDKPLPAPLSVRVILKDEPTIPAEGLAISYRFKTGRGDILPSTAQTNYEGLVSSSIIRVGSSGSEGHSLSASLHLSEFLDYSGYGEEWNKRVSAGQKEILFSLERKKDSESTRVLVVMQNLNSSGEESVVLRDRLYQYFTDSGFSPVDKTALPGIDGEFVGKISRNIGSESLRRQLSNIAVVVFIEASQPDCNTAQGMKVCGVTGTVRAITVNKGQTIAARSFQNILGFGLTGTQAAANAYKKAAEQVSEPLINDILEANVTVKMQ